MLSIINTASDPGHKKALRDWFLTEWNQLDPFEGNVPGFIVPAPLLAMEDETLVGGLAFTSHTIPGSATLAVWINALLVAPEFRSRGIASRLVMAAEVEATRLGIGELFVYTNVAALYRKLGWMELSTDNGNSVLRKILRAAPEAQA